MKAEELIAELKEADATLNSDNYKSWSQVRLAIASAINYITPEEPEAVHGNEAEKEVLNDFISAIQTEFADTNWDYLPFIAERVLENRKNG